MATVQGVKHDELLMSGKYDVAAFSAPDPVLIAIFQRHLNPYPVQSVLIPNTYLSH